MSENASAPLMLSISGARGIVGQTMTPEVAHRFACAFGSWLIESVGKSTPTVVLGRDSRPSGPTLAQAVAAGLAAVGCSVIDLGLAMTPTVGVMIGECEADGGMMITASHNPGQWNGLKCLNHDGVAPPPDDAHEIIRRFTESSEKPASVSTQTSAQQDSRGVDIHLARVLATVNIDAIHKHNFKVVLDSINGAGCEGGRRLLEELGCTVIHINGEPTGDFAHLPEPTKKNLQGLCDVVKQQGAAIGFAQDPDADRLAIVDDLGTYIGEEYTLALCAKQILDGLNNSNSGTGVSPVNNTTTQHYFATNLSTSRMIDTLANAHPTVTVLRTAVGEANVVAAMKQHGSNALLGGEGNGGVIYPPVCLVRDSLGSMALVLSLLAHHQQPLSRIVADMPSYVMIKQKFDLSTIGGLEAVPAILNRVREQFSKEKIDDTDGVRIDFDHGWVHLRPSNTEPIIRLIAEAETKAAATALIETISNAGLQGD